MIIIVIPRVVVDGKDTHRFQVHNTRDGIESTLERHLLRQDTTLKIHVEESLTTDDVMALFECLLALVKQAS
jgi:hypothetical protein